MTVQPTRDQQESELDYWMTRAYEAEKRAWQAEARVKAVRDLHEPDWLSLPCPHHPIKGCGADDCHPTGATFTGSPRYRHAKGWAACLGCNAEGYCEDPVEWPCPTIRALEG